MIAVYRSVTELRLHPAAERIPPMTDDERKGLLAGVAAHGIQVPLDVTADGVVLDGRHRLGVALDLGLAEVPVRVVTPDDDVDYMLAMAIERRQLNAGQRAALAIDRHDYQAARAEAHRRKTDGSNEVRATLPEAERPRDLAARLGGVSARTVQDAITVRSADPQLFEKVRAGAIPVHHAAEQVRRALRFTALTAVPALPEGPFNVVYADPPWRSKNPASDRAPERHYPTLDLEEIKALNVPAADDAVCFLWAVNPLLPEALEVLAGWGFEHRTNLVWVKNRIGLGFYVRGQHELLLLGTRGSMPLPAEADRPASVIRADRRAHSAKPELVYELIERMYPGLPRIELFARQRRAGWAAWGNEIGEEREVA